MSIEDTIQIEITNRDTAKTNYEKLEYQNNILQLKVNNLTVKYKTEIYTDLKFFVKYYINSLEEKKHGYDEINLNKIFYYLKYIDVQERAKLLKFLIRLLKLNGYEEDLNACYKKFKEAELSHCIKKPHKYFHKIIFLLTTYNVFSIVLTIFLIVIITSFVLLPAPEWSKPLVSVKYHNYNTNFYWNHFLNVSSGFLGISDEYKVQPLNTGGYFLCMFGKAAFLIIIVNVLVDQVGKRIKF